MPNTDPQLQNLMQILQQSNMPADLKTRCTNMLSRMASLQQTDQVQASYSLQEQEITRKYLEWILGIPFGKYTQDNLNLENTKQILNKNHFGLDAIKENILQYISAKTLLIKKQQGSAAAQNQPATTNNVQQSTPVPQPAGQAQITPSSPTKVPNAFNYTPTSTPTLCFVGVQGIGKTTMAQSIAESLGRKFTAISLSAFASVADIRGRNKAEPGAEPGQIIKVLGKAGTMNPVILLDEIDKTSSDMGLKTDIMAALLEVLDPSQNKHFVDRYIDYPIDLSQVLFITTANNLSGITAALLDRLEVVRFHSYTDQEKQVIAKTYLLPKVMRANGIDEQTLAISEEAWPSVIRPLGFDPGIRQLERNLTLLARKVAKMVVEGHKGTVTITQQNFREFFPERIEVMS